MSDEEDYMSDKFLSECINNDIRPGLIRSPTEKRNFEVLKRKRELDEVNRKKNPSIRVMESEKRKAGLEKPIEQDNKGFAMLQKMGYKPGNSIGRNEKGPTEPIPIEIKTDREGLGRSQARKEVYEMKLKEIRSNTVSPNEYRSRITEKVILKQIEGDLRKSQRMCERFDSDNNILQPVEKWYWFSTDPENEDKNSQKFKQTVKRNYDNGTAIDSERCMDYDQTHMNFNSSESDENDENDDELPSLNLSMSEKLWDLTTYLRNKYMYCIWCSVQYDDEDDLQETCPGRTREVH